MLGSNDFVIATAVDVLLTNNKYSIYNSYGFQKTKFNDEVFKNTEGVLVRNAFNIREDVIVVSSTHEVLLERTKS